MPAILFVCHRCLMLSQRPLLWFRVKTAEMISVLGSSKLGWTSFGHSSPGRDGALVLHKP